MYKDVYRIFNNINKKIIQNSWNNYTFVIPLNESNTNTLVYELNKYIKSNTKIVDINVVEVKFFNEYHVIIVEKKIGKIDFRIKLYVSIVYSDHKFVCDVIKGKIGFLPIYRKLLPLDTLYVIDANEFPIDIYGFNLNVDEVVFSFKINTKIILSLQKNIIIEKTYNRKCFHNYKICMDILLDRYEVEKKLSSYLRYYLKSKKFLFGFKVYDTYINAIDDNIIIIVDWHGVKIEVSILAKLSVRNSIINFNVKDIHVNNKGIPKKIYAALNAVVSKFRLNMYKHGLSENIIIDSIGKVAENNFLSVEFTYQIGKDNNKNNVEDLECFFKNTNIIEHEYINVSLNAENVQKITDQIISNYKENTEMLKEFDVDIISCSQMCLSSSNIYVCCRYYLSCEDDNVYIKLHPDKCRIMQKYVPNDILTILGSRIITISLKKINETLPVKLHEINNDIYLNIEVKI